jgi:hypothetical protein
MTVRVGPAGRRRDAAARVSLGGDLVGYEPRGGAHPMGRQPGTACGGTVHRGSGAEGDQCQSLPGGWPWDARHPSGYSLANSEGLGPPAGGVVTLVLGRYPAQWVPLGCWMFGDRRVGFAGVTAATDLTPHVPRWRRDRRRSPCQDQYSPPADPLSSAPSCGPHVPSPGRSRPRVGADPWGRPVVPPLPAPRRLENRNPAGQRGRSQHQGE